MQAQNNIKVSLVTAVYGVERYIERFARSVFSQDCDGVEFIVVDDCTKDASIARLESVLAREFPHLQGRVTILRNETNRGLHLSRRRGVAAARGDYVAMVDSDDYLAPDYVSTMLAAAQNNAADVVICDAKFVYPTFERRAVVPDFDDKRSLLRGFCAGAMMNAAKE